MARGLCVILGFACAILTAGISPVPQSSGTEIVSITGSLTPQPTIRIRASADISTYQRPERTTRGFVIRIPGVSVQSEVLDSVSRTAPFRTRVETVRGTAVITIAAAPRDSLVVRRDGSRALLCTLISPESSSSDSTGTPVAKGRWDLDVIVIDAGHGGQDVGAEGVNGVFEKDVTLSIARKLRTHIRELLPNAKVVMTRETDVFIELYRRTQIANEASGKLFVSIHCNSMPTKPHPAHGCETYILRPGRNDDAARVAARENSSVRFERSTDVYRGMTDDQIIVATMAQRSFVRLSETFAAGIQRTIKSTTPLADRGVNQAGFFVLVGASMPNVLVETGFLSNTTDAAYLASKSGQDAIALALANAIRSYATSYSRSIRTGSQ